MGKSPLCVHNCDCVCVCVCVCACACVRACVRACGVQNDEVIGDTLEI